MSTTFSYTQIIVDDITAMTHFYSSVFGMREVHRMKVDNGQPVEEVMMQCGESPSHVLVLVQLLDGTPTVHGEVLLGFSPDDFDAVLERAVAHGAEVVKEPFRLSDLGDKYSGDPSTIADDRLAIFMDPEGHACQIIESSAQSG